MLPKCSYKKWWLSLLFPSLLFPVPIISHILIGDNEFLARMAEFDPVATNPNKDWSQYGAQWQQ